MNVKKFELMHDTTKLKSEVQKVIYFIFHDEHYTREDIANNLLEILCFIDDNLDTIKTEDIL